MKLDRIDRKILEMLQEDGRIPFADIARKLGIGETTVRYRVEKLRKERVIQKIVALIDPRKIGLNITAIIMLKIDPARLNEACEELAKFDEVHHLLQSTGEYDATIVAHTKDMDHLGDLVRRIKLVEGVRDALVSVSTRLIKIETRFKLG